MDPATSAVLYLRVVDAMYESAMPDAVLIKPGGIARREVSRGEKPSPEIMSVLKVVNPPLGTYAGVSAFDSETMPNSADYLPAEQ